MRDANLMADFLADRARRRIVYHVGLLARDRENTSTLSKEDRAAINVVARAAWNASAAGKLFLVQRRLPSGDFEYIAIKAAAA